ncbi:hypothetical protein [Dyella thiooxydans]|nr:hypothetical protein [Dyella thiooxydans]
MRVSFTPSVLSDARYFSVLDVVALLVEEERHVVDADTLQAIERSEWVAQRPSDLYEFLEHVALAASYTPRDHRSIVEIDDAAPIGGEYLESAGVRRTRVRPLEALLFLSTPFQIVVENEEYDGAFLLWMSRLLSQPRLLKAYRQQRFVFRHAGGKDSIVRSMRIFSAGIWARSDGRYRRDFRMWLGAFLDNDAKHGADDPNADIVRQAGQLGIFTHQLSKRSIESYLPQSALLARDRSRDFKRKVEALFRMTVEQRRHYHMKRGFRIEKRPVSKADYFASAAISSEEKALYGSVSEQDWVLLAEGFGSGLSSIFVEETGRPDQRMTVAHTDDAVELGGLIDAICEAL